MDEIFATIKNLHSYETPAVIVLPTLQVEPQYQQWLLEQLHTKP